MVPINLKNINNNNIIVKKNNYIYYSTECVTLNALNINFKLKNIKFVNNKCIYNYNENKDIFNRIEQIEQYILNYKKQSFYNLKKIFSKNFFYILNNKNELDNKINNRKYKNMNFILILNKVQVTNNNSYLKVKFIIHPLNNN